MSPGKLKWAGRAWADGLLDEDGEADELDQDAAFWGIDPARLKPHDATGIWPEHIPAVMAFLSVQSQWRWVSPGPGFLLATGLDYSGVRVGLECEGITLSPALWGDLRVIEAGAREALNEVQE